MQTCVASKLCHPTSYLQSQWIRTSLLNARGSYSDRRKAIGVLRLERLKTMSKGTEPEKGSLAGLITCRNTSYYSILCKIIKSYRIGIEENKKKSK